MSKLIPLNGTFGDGFGFSVATNENFAVVGAPYDDDFSGSTYVFDTSTGSQLLKLVAPVRKNGELFGSSVAISSKYAIVGAPSSPTRPNSLGAAYVFDVTTGMQIAKLSATDGVLGDNFGWSVGISENKAIIGAMNHDAGGLDAGAAYVFDIVTGQQVFKLSPDGLARGDGFGISVGINGNRAIVGAFRNDEPGGASDTIYEDVGAAFLFNISTGEQETKLLPTDPHTYSQFGQSVAISEKLCIVGKPWHDGSGSAYVFNSYSGQEIAKLSGSDFSPDSQIGWSVSVYENKLFVGTRGGANVYLFVPEPSGLVALSSVILSLLFCRSS